MCWKDNWRTRQRHSPGLETGEPPFSIKSFRSRDALFSHQSAQTTASISRRLPGAPRPHPHVPSAWFFFNPLGFTHYAMLVSFRVALGEKKNTDVHFSSHLSFGCCIVAQGKCSGHPRKKCLVTATESTLDKCYFRHRPTLNEKQSL